MKNKVNWWRTSFAGKEMENIKKAISEEHVSQGPVVAEFEKKLGEFLGVPHVVATTSGSSATLMSLWAAGVGPGDEVIVPNYTWIAAAHAPLLLGATVKLVDVEKHRPIIDANALRGAISKKTKAIIPVHLNGRAADMAQINSLASEHGICVVEDAAQALGSRNATGLLGTQADFGIFSLSVAKIIATGQGGFVVPKTEESYIRLTDMRTHGVENVIDSKWTLPGFNFRFTDILASIGIAQLEKLPERRKHMIAIYREYEEAAKTLPFLKIIPVRHESGEIPIYAEFLCECRDELMAYLKDQGIETRKFYPTLDSASYLPSNGDFPNSKPYGTIGMILPCGPDQPLENIRYVISKLQEFKPRS